MKYALIENGVVINTILLSPYNASDFPDAISIDGIIVQKGDTYTDGRFYRDGEPIYSEKEKLIMINKELNATYEELTAAYQEGVNEA